MLLLNRFNWKVNENTYNLSSSWHDSYNEYFKIQIPKYEPIFSSKTEKKKSSPLLNERSLEQLKMQQKMLEFSDATGHSPRKHVLPVMPLTCEEEFQVMDYIVRIEHYQNKRFEFVCKNFDQIR